MTFPELREEILEVLGRGVDQPLGDTEFNDLALRVFRFQCLANRAYGGFVVRRGVDPGALERWEEIPPLPTRAFKTAHLVAGPEYEVERIFRTSGTTLGLEGRGEHHIRDLSLYRASLLPNLEVHLLGGLPGRTRFFCLLSSSEDAPDSSLSFMMGEAVERWGDPDSRFFLETDGTLRATELHDCLERAAAERVPVVVVGTAFALAHWLDLAEAEGWRTSLPEGSRVMETGGYKGRSRKRPREELYRALSERLGVPWNLIVNEYGMTELLSQFYEPVLRRPPAAPPTEVTDRSTSLEDRFHVGPPWTRTRVLHPFTLEATPRGEVGVLSHVDLANLGSVAFVLTEDMGRATPRGFQVLGRAEGSEPRGCSLAMEDFLATRRGEA